MMRVKCIISILAAVLVMGTVAVAEDIKNDSGCDVCDGAIHFGPDETIRIFGEETRQKINEMWWQGQKNVWIDLDGVWKNTDAPENEGPFEIKIYGTVLRIFVKSLLDDSTIELIVNNVEQAENDAPVNVSIDWLPEIYLYAGHAEPINLDDSLDAAWNKMQERHVFQWVSRGKEVRANPEAMREQIVSALKALSP